MSRERSPHGHRAKVGGGLDELCRRVRKFVQPSTENDSCGVLSQTVVCDRGQMHPGQARSGLALMAARILLTPRSGGCAG